MTTCWLRSTKAADTCTDAAEKGSTLSFYISTATCQSGSTKAADICTDALKKESILKGYLNGNITATYWLRSTKAADTCKNVTEKHGVLPTISIATYRFGSIEAEDICTNVTEKHRVLNLYLNGSMSIWLYQSSWYLYACYRKNEMSCIFSGAIDMFERSFVCMTSLSSWDVLPAAIRIIKPTNLVGTPLRRVLN